MSLTLAPYPHYCPLSAGYLGDVPDHWDVRLLRSVLTGTNMRNQPDLPLLSVVRERGVILRDVNNSEENHNFIPDDLSNYKVVKDGQFAMNKMKAWQGSYGVSQHDGIVSPAYFVFDLQGVDRGYFHTAIRSRAYVPFFAQASDGVRIGQWDLSQSRMREIPFLLPPLPEQWAIVRYLDHVDQRIRRYVDAKRKLVALLEEEKQSVINQAVTRGLDPNVRLKPSGVEWLGDVPEHWELCRLRNVVSVVTTGSRGWSQYASDSGPLFIRVANLSRGSLDLRFDDTVRLDLPKTSEIARTRIHRGDLLVSVTAYIGSIAVAPKDLEEAYVSQHVARCEPLPGSFSRWLGYVLLSTVGQTHGQISLYGGTKDGLSLDDVKNYPILLPPPSEQTSIVKHIDKANATIDDAISRTRRQVKLVEEYRTRLIADVVTGKLDVRDAAAQLPDEAEDDVPIGEGGPQQNGFFEGPYGAEREPAIAEEVTT